VHHISLHDAAAQPLCMQDLPLAAARERLKLPPFAAAVCDVLRASADAVPSLQSLPLEEVGDAL
jgi:hypothetical protein